LPPGEGERPEVQLRIRSLSSADTVGPVAYDPRLLSPRTGTLKAGVAAMAGHRVLVMIEVDKKTPENALLVAPPQLDTRRSRKQPRPGGPESRQTSATPDIIVIILDAARPDRFSSYGYERETTPNLDRLAQDALVFRNAFALAPYTSCSVPTMVTGLSFLDHQVVRRGDRLSAEVTTLAEYLKTAGYRTACISATPNNSRSLGTHQGYDDFIETWHIVPRGESIDAALLSQMALDWLESNDTGAPIHLQLHYVPPHGPYTPDEEFDLFTDPAYDGPFDGSNHVIAAVDSHRWWARPQDLAHMNALYDGNLREADAAVERVLEALRARPRWRDTVVLVTADHGEAFFEHDRMGHNSTVFDEMLRVPFILRLSTGAANMQGIKLDRLVTLADIVPTLVGLAGMESVPEVAGLNLLRPPPAGESIHGRHLVARTATVPPVYAIRNLHHKLILSTSGQGALFDLERDPGERNDLVLIDRPSLVGLGMLLTGELARPARFDPAPELDEIPEKDVEMLKALGYLQ
jgi:arylsulfatase A-like enzyme